MADPPKGAIEASARSTSSWPATPPKSIPGRWTGPQHRCAGCREPGLEAGPGDQEDIAGSLLDTYHAERHPIAARVLRTTMAASALRRPDDRTTALRDTIAELLSLDEPRKQFAATMSGLGIRYDLGEGHPLLGRRMPDLDLVTADGALRRWPC
jgi:hypothetical protein